METSVAVLSVGFLAQGFFSARVLVQWLLSERARSVLSPSVFWVLSVAGAWLLCVYGWLRGDFAIVMGQLLSYYIYLWNLKSKGVWAQMPLLLRWVLLLTPIVAVGWVANDADAFIKSFLCRADVPLWLVAFGSAGQLLFTLRFVYQWIYSARRGRSCLPAGFWLLSLAGSLSIVAYGILRTDAVLIVGQSFGVVAYVRNLTIIYHEKNQNR